MAEGPEAEQQAQVVDRFKRLEDVLIILSAFVLGCTLLYSGQAWTKPVQYVLLALMAFVLVCRIGRLAGVRRPHPPMQDDDGEKKIEV